MADESKKPDANRPEGRRQGENFVARLVPDPANPPDLMRLSGYRGASSVEGSVRLYGNPELSFYWDIPEGDVVYEQSVPQDTDPLGAVILWVKRDSKTTFNSAGSQSQGGAQQMFTGGTGAAAAPQTPNFQLTAPITIHTINSLYIQCPPSPPPLFCVSPHPHCPPSPPPLFCVSPIPHCPPPSPLYICQVSPTPVCFGPVSPTCPPTPQTTIPTQPTTQPTTIAAGPQATGFQAAPQGAGQQALTFGTPGTITTLPHTVYNCPSHVPIYCPTPSALFHCTIPQSILCNSPTPVCVQPPVSPTCTPFTPGSIPTTISPGTESPVAGGGFGQVAGLQAAPQAATQFGALTGPTGGAQLQPVSPPVVCWQVSPLWFQCHHSWYQWQCHPSPLPICLIQYPQQQISPVGPAPTTPAPTGTPVAAGGAGQGIEQQAYTTSLPTYTNYPTWPIFPTRPTHPTWPTWPTITRPTVTVTIGTYQ